MLTALYVLLIAALALFPLALGLRILWKKLGESLAEVKFLKAVLDAAPFFCAAFDGEGRLLYRNRKDAGTREGEMPDGAEKVLIPWGKESRAAFFCPCFGSRSGLRNNDAGEEDGA